MDIATILEIENLRDYKFHAARWNQIEQPLNAFVRSREDWHGWNKWRGGKDEFNRKYIISFIQFYPDGQETWLFGGIYEVLGRGEKNSHSYVVKLTDKGKDLIGRLKVQIKLSRGRAFRLESLYERLSVCEVFREPYSGAVFCGYENVSQDFFMLEAIFKNERTDWKTALENVKGVYVIADNETGRKYVGSAYGDSGIWSRWSQYMHTGHGWNKELVGLLKDAGLEYARKNFRITLLECWPFKTDDKTIIHRESFWKEALLTRGKHGYNSN